MNWADGYPTPDHSFDLYFLDTKITFFLIFTVIPSFLIFPLQNTRGDVMIITQSCEKLHIKYSVETFSLSRNWNCVQKNLVPVLLEGISPFPFLFIFMSTSSYVIVTFSSHLSNDLRGGKVACHDWTSLFFKIGLVVIKKSYSTHHVKK